MGHQLSLHPVPPGVGASADDTGSVHPPKPKPNPTPIATKKKPETKVQKLIEEMFKKTSEPQPTWTGNLAPKLTQIQTTQPKPPPNVTTQPNTNPKPTTHINLKPSTLNPNQSSQKPINHQVKPTTTTKPMPKNPKQTPITLQKPTPEPKPPLINLPKPTPKPNQLKQETSKPKPVPNYTIKTHLTTSPLQTTYNQQKPPNPTTKPAPHPKPTPRAEDQGTRKERGGKQLSNKTKNKLVELKNQPKLTQFVMKTNKKMEGKEKSMEQEKEDKKEERWTEDKEEEETQVRGRLQEDKMDRWKMETRIGDETTLQLVKPSPQKQLQTGRKTPVNSVQLKIRAFTQKFNIPPNEIKPPPPTNEYGRRPRQNVTSANEHQLSGEGKTSVRNVKTDEIGGFEGKGII